MSSPDQKHSELLGNGFLKSGFIVALWALLPNRQYSFYEVCHLYFCLLYVIELVAHRLHRAL